MFLNRRKKREREFKERFDKLMYTAKSLKDNEAIYTLLKAIMRPTQSEYLLAIAEKCQSKIPKLTADVLFFNGLDEYLYTFPKHQISIDTNNYIVRLQNDIVLPWPWDTARYINATNNIGSSVGNKWQYRNNHVVDMWLPWKLVFVINGNHSIASGILNSEGHLPLRYLVNCSVLLETIHTDGIFWYVNGKKTEKVNNYRHAAFFEIGRLLIKNSSDL